MAKDHYGLDVKLLEVGSTDVKAVFESCDLDDTTTTKEAQAAQDTGPNRRTVGNDWTLSLNTFVRGNLSWLIEYCRSNRDDISLQLVMTEPGTGASGTIFKTLTFSNAKVSKIGLGIGSEATKQSLEFVRGESDYVVT